jgi:hypothetical protein
MRATVAADMPDGSFGDRNKELGVGTDRGTSNLYFISLKLRHFNLLPDVCTHPSPAPAIFQPASKVNSDMLSIARGCHTCAWQYDTWKDCQWDHKLLLCPIVIAV